jgi:hypothetical protein
VLAKTTLELEMEVAEIKTRLHRVERALRKQTNSARHGSPPQDLPMNNEDLLAWMREHGLVSDPVPDDVRLAAQWDDLSDEEKDAHVRLMHGLALDPSLSEIIIEQRR